MYAPCECPGPGFCKRFNREMTGRLYDICSAKYELGVLPDAKRTAQIESFYRSAGFEPPKPEDVDPLRPCTCEKAGQCERWFGKTMSEMDWMVCRGKGINPDSRAEFIKLWYQQSGRAAPVLKKVAIPGPPAPVLKTRLPCVYRGPSIIKNGQREYRRVRL